MNPLNPFLSIWDDFILILNNLSLFWPWDVATQRQMVPILMGSTEQIFLKLSIDAYVKTH